MQTSTANALRILGIVLLAIVLVLASLTFLLVLVMFRIDRLDPEATAWIAGYIVLAAGSLAGIVALGRGIRLSRATEASVAPAADPAALRQWGEYLRYALFAELFLSALGFAYGLMTNARRPQSLAVSVVFLLLYQTVYVYALAGNYPEVKRVPTTVILAFASCSVVLGLLNSAQLASFYVRQPVFAMQHLGGMVVDVAISVFAFRARRAMAPGPEHGPELAGCYVCSAAYLSFLQIFSGKIVQLLSSGPLR